MRTAALLAACLLSAAPAARGDTTGREAGKHFQRGVDLYTDGDFRGALVEFKRAYALLPRANVLYDIGETEFQLQDYAAALGTMRRFLSETGPGTAHRAEVEATVESLRGRVGRIAVSADAPRCEVAIDDLPVGTTPLPDAVLVSVGTRRVTVTCAGRPPSSRRVDVAAGELARVELRVGPALTGLAEPPREATHPAPPAPARMSRAVLALTWTSTALLAAATLGVGTAALVESADLRGLRQTYPVTAEAIGQRASLVRGLSIAADTLGVAALAAIGVSTYVTVRYHKERRLGVGLTAGLGGASVYGAF